MSGSVTPVMGMIPMVIPTLTKTWNMSIAATPAGDQRAEQVLRHHDDPQRAPDQQRVQAQHERRADEAVLLADGREDEVGVVLGHEAVGASGWRCAPRPVFWPEPIAIFDSCCW